MSPADQAWLTKGGGKPDINDEFILARAPNKGKAVAKPAAAAAVAAPAAGGAAAAPAAGGAAAAAPASVKVDPADLDKADQEMGAAMTANAASAAPAAPAAPEAPKIDPAKLARFKELLAKASK